MMIHKHKLEITDYQKIKLPKGSSILHVGSQQEDLYIWVRVHPKSKVFEEREIHIVGTGFDDLHNHDVYIGTVDNAGQDGVYVWHVFEVIG